MISGKEMRSMVQFEIWFNDLKEEQQKALLRAIGIQWPDEADLYETPIAIMETETIDITGYKSDQETGQNEKIENMFNSLNDNEKHGLIFGLFPIRIMKYDLTNEESAELINMAHEIA